MMFEVIVIVVIIPQIVTKITMFSIASWILKITLGLVIRHEYQRFRSDDGQKKISLKLLCTPVFVFAFHISNFSLQIVHISKINLFINKCVFIYLILRIRGLQYFIYLFTHCKGF